MPKNHSFFPVSFNYCSIFLYYVIVMLSTNPLMARKGGWLDCAVRMFQKAKNFQCFCQNISINFFRQNMDGGVIKVLNLAYTYRFSFFGELIVCQFRFVQNQIEYVCKCICGISFHIRFVCFSVELIGVLIKSRPFPRVMSSSLKCSTFHSNLVFCRS